MYEGSGARGVWFSISFVIMYFCDVVSRVSPRFHLLVLSGFWVCFGGPFATWAELVHDGRGRGEGRRRRELLLELGHRTRLPAVRGGAGFAI